MTALEIIRQLALTPEVRVYRPEGRPLHVVRVTVGTGAGEVSGVGIWQAGRRVGLIVSDPQAVNALEQYAPFTRLEALPPRPTNRY